MVMAIAMIGYRTGMGRMLASAAGRSYGGAAAAAAGAAVRQFAMLRSGDTMRQSAANLAAAAIAGWALHQVMTSSRSEGDLTFPGLTLDKVCDRPPGMPVGRTTPGWASCPTGVLQPTNIGLNDPYTATELRAAPAVRSGRDLISASDVRLMTL